MPPSTRPPRSGRRLALAAVAVSAALHGLLLATLSLPGGAPPGGEPDALIIAPAPRVEPPRRRPAAEEPASRAAPRARSDPAPAPATAAPRPAPDAPLERTIPPSTLRAFRGAPLPLVVTPTGIGRRTVAPDPRRLARARAESLLAARLADLPGTERRDTGGIGLANGGVTVAVPWGGFVRSDRTDAAWREKRCAGRGDGGDKPGENEARGAQC